MAKNLEVVLLTDYYGEMLTENQRKFIDYYYNDDLSLSEKDLVKIVGRMPVGIGVVADNRFVLLKK